MSSDKPATHRVRLLPVVMSQIVMSLLLATPALDAAANGDANWTPKGHYLSFARERDLQAEVTSIMDAPHTAPSNHHLDIAQGIDEAFRTPGIKGVWMGFEWRSIEVADGEYDWSAIDRNLEVARRYGLRLIVKIADRSFDGSNILPVYFPTQYVLQSTGERHNGYVSKRWDPYVYNRLIRLYTAIAERYGSDPAFGGVATAETAIGSFSGTNYSVAAYQSALREIATRTQAALQSGRLFLYMNFLKGGDSSDMNQDARVAVATGIPHNALVVGGPDVTPDMRGIVGSVTSYRIHLRKTAPTLPQFCHFQHVDQGLGDLNVKTNEHRQDYLDRVATARHREQQSWFDGIPAVFRFDDLRDPHGNKVDLHPASVLGQLWTPAELFAFGRRNFDCDYALWHYRDHTSAGEFSWPDVRAVVEENPCFHTESCAATATPQPPAML